MLVACAFTASSAFGIEPTAEVRIEDVMFPDLNLATAAGVDALYQRIHAAARRVCAVSGQTEAGESASAKCSKEAEARAIEKVNLPALTAFAAHR
jgi:UrcA family protein